MGGQAAVPSDSMHSISSSGTEDTVSAVIRASGFNLDLVQYIAEDTEMNLFKLKSPIIKLPLYLSASVFRVLYSAFKF